eukprot:1156505-Pelagomonas_calceolata.AAC.4
MEAYDVHASAQEFKPAHRTAKEMPALLVKAAASPACIGVRPSVLAAAVLAVSGFDVILLAG